ncbi:WD40-repeat-containing domain protein [Chytridium lagenaria]|nr:WD40-repeat-containing domain protein [Chytridium lagenaria]
MSIAAVAHRHVFGLKGDVKDNIAFLDEQTVIYPAGANAILYNTETKSQKFIPVSDRCEGITALAVAPNKRHAAIGERGERPVAVIYDMHTLRKRKALTPPDGESKEFVCMAFSTDAKYIITQTGAPDWTLYYWTWEKTKLMASVRTALHGALPQHLVQLHHMRGHRWERNRCQEIQAGCLGISEGMLKAFQFQKIEPRMGVLLIFESNGELRLEIPFTFGNSPTAQVPRACHSILSFSKGFVAAGSGGNVVIFEKGDDGVNANNPNATAASQQGVVEGEKVPGARELYRRVKDYQLPDEGSRVMNLAISSSEDNLLCSLENNQMFAITLASAEVKGDEARFESFSQPFHHGQITGMDTCIRKPLIATCSSDRSVRVWNYIENSSELVKYFPEEAYSVAIHPSGLYILVGFSDKLRLMNLLIDDIRTFREFTVRGCRECRFSHGGQYFAAVHGNTIQIYSTWNFENLGNLKGHNGKICRGNSGGSGIKREGESILKSCSYTSAVATPDGRSIFAVGSDKTLKLVDSQIVRELESDTVLTQVALSHSGRMMFVGTANGTIRSMKFPLGNEPGEYQEHTGHSGPSPNSASSEDGSLYIYKISDKEGRGMKRDREIVYADEILVTKSDLEEKNQMMAELKTRVEELKMENEYQLRLKDMNFKRRLRR